MAYRPAREGNLLSLYINNRAGGLIFHRDFSPNAAKLDTNEQMQLASTFSGLALIMGQLAPSRPSSGMQLLEADGFLLQSFDSPTGIKFFLTAEPDAKGLDLVLREVYTYYADYVLKNPFYEMDMPIQKGGKFCQKLDRMVAQVQDRR
ncbi:hypothetical protein EMIHUDRAFT_71104 [Emiliania huxleyi CCMP1516]|uniref:Trafficking protein particle complex subunit n=2 Tax=Emiliania huxleyi TaxID=2903 RepID=A0A0D3KIM5_EMIH1|nr:trafficking protein particle complex subunit 4 [Emiliania huxleyi CCMP1516]XP_005788039.1 hypothetical protein EMIHUDRAFT_71104 [Emiliania huxleyi CCMP1516]EOD09033.1 trafficking protein particle complex subunit 4 [Emiliania huxleyi CCMP1516]EOD35610.1 hypothetical protein EMIHUDRAFT_71104 [Emiliania huxleyi CCMP1516]|mmetsp:Transcript_287/g.1065  ORF Transcript_287/g.1065 Transcript_287/m.1065 type:complete len:148 (+) Transcript_287:119-562(+)|eukprot:XP_005761462.1 trafficking protein particle complex subunit 4 [Emiliania huxleyi CCMP1516]